MKHSPYDKWQAAFVAEVKGGKRGVQRRLAEYTGKTPRYINDVFKGRRNASQGLQVKLADALGRTYEEMLQIGSDLLEKGGSPPPFPNYEEIMRLPILDRAWAILRTAGEQHGITDHMSSCGASPKPEFAKKFLAGEINEEELCAECYERMRKIAALLKDRFRKMGVEIGK